MEVLSVGEKIKRARIYKGYTLKDVCGEEISVSKLSCIENGKVDAEYWVLEYIAEKLEMDFEYLKQSVDEQININIKKILKNSDKESYNDDLQYNLDLAERYGYYDIGLKIMHMIFEHNLEKHKLKEAQRLIGRYYDLSNKSSFKYRRNMYYMDVGKYFYKNKEYYQSINYFKNVTKNIMWNKDEDHNFLVDAMYFEASAYLKTGKYDEAYQISLKLNDLLNCIDESLKKANVYHMMAVIYLKLDKSQFKKYETKAYEMYGDDIENKAIAMYSFATVMFEAGLREMAQEYIKKAIDLYPRENDEKLVDFILKCIEELVNNKDMSFVSELSDEALNLSIKIDNVRFVEKAYYLKAKVLIEQNTLIMAEMYMSLSLDALNKFGTKKQICERYMEMGKMYYDMAYTSDSIRYFSLAMSMQKKL
ncbi:helix-turn-helix transcriptional regulator [Clostridium sp. MB40-C1]|uniref:helix-turn-helix domain-containing protein n=1 Tax=Clostridium sp. MB40-C1 TaxID=3070996 RepID=UPI0027E154C3|nr:helix-turn-helix transcriptional regulator [Clostridium sp. MB40-C1]WMJ80806.1 helix-turn-helix transcriptional regulator [Clostridium sp. MB40-C1]